MKIETRRNSHFSSLFLFFDYFPSFNLYLMICFYYYAYKQKQKKTKKNEAKRKSRRIRIRRRRSRWNTKRKSEVKLHKLQAQQNKQTNKRKRKCNDLVERVLKRTNERMQFVFRVRLLFRSFRLWKNYSRIIGSVER